MSRNPDRRVAAAPHEAEARGLQRRVASYLAAVGGAALAADAAEAAIVASTTPQPIGINGAVNVDFNSDGQVDFQIDHDRYALNGTNLDYLQIDKNDVNGASNPLPIDGFATFPTNGTQANGDASVLSFTNDFGDNGGYAVGLKAGDMIGADSGGSLIPGTVWDFQEGSNFLGGGTTIRANRLIDEDRGQIDQALAPGTQVTVPFGPQPEFPNLDDFLGVGGQTRYLGVRVDLNDAAFSGLNKANEPDYPTQFWYGWIGVRIDNEADATGVVTGWAYESERGKAIAAGDTGPAVAGDYNGDQRVDGRDLLVWQRQLGQTVTAGSGADGNRNGTVDGPDLTVWEGAFPTAAVAAGSSVGVPVPEPASWVAAVLGAAVLGLAWLGGRERRRRVPVLVPARSSAPRRLP